MSEPVREPGAGALGPLTVLGLLVAGAACGAAATLVHRWGWGLAIGLFAAVLGVVALPAGSRRLAFAAGWMAAVGLALWPRPEGDYLIAADAVGYALLIASFGVFLVALVTLPGRGSPTPRDGDDQGEVGRRT
ncbi:hypothetical protein [Nocardioides piscis]|uniref:Uncharacterized protein n=1 Tax=Nocardioides piscis TaxID=2714938 RepID=A0A6G7YBY5_9ACTN|nr:hypothetical protein [Nocardioides piscis]QIK74161.1 hypothetical protein G7071_00625 [Nocardioides piscis]